jgi:hypothetical protein
VKEQLFSVKPFVWESFEDNQKKKKKKNAVATAEE